MSALPGRLLLGGFLLLSGALAGQSQPPGEGGKAAPEEKKPAKLDAYGDPLPDAAMARMGTVRFRSTMYVQSLAFSPDAKMIATAGNEATIRLWDAMTGKEVRRLAGHQSTVTSVASVVKS